MAAFVQVRARRDQVLDIEGPRDRRRQPAVGGGDDGHQVAGVAVALQQFHRLRPDRRRDHFAHVLRVQVLQACRVETGQGAEGELEVFDRIEGAGLVLVEEFFVAALVGVAVDHLVPHQELAPLEVGVERQQGVVEVKQREVAHSLDSFCGFPCSSRSRSRGSVTGRWVSSEYWSRASSMVDRERMSRLKWDSK